MFEKLNFSIAMSIYKSDNPEYLKIAIDSIINQTLKPAEIVVVGDGPVPDTILKVIDEVKKKATQKNIDLRFLPQSQNQGIGAAGSFA